MADEETLFVVVSIDEPAGNGVGVIAADFAGVGMKDIDAVDFDVVANTGDTLILGQKCAPGDGESLNSASPLPHCRTHPCFIQPNNAEWFGGDPICDR